METSRYLLESGRATQNLYSKDAGNAWTVSTLEPFPFLVHYLITSNQCPAPYLVRLQDGRDIQKNMNGQNIVMGFIGAVCVGTFLMVANQGITRAELNECRKLQAQAVQFNGWYATQAERAQCEALGVNLPANK